jgi:hypothetical protein
MLRTIRWTIVVLVLAAPPLILACASSDCEDLGTCPPDGGADAGTDADGAPQ